MTIQVHIINAFIDGETGGNPAGVVLNADSLSAQQKLQVAQQVGLSETAFVSRSDSADFKLDFFTPNRQIAHCGHATIATFSYLAQCGLIPASHTSKETIDGNRDIEIRQHKAFMEQVAPQYRSVQQSEGAILQALGLNQQGLAYPPTLVNTGNSFVLVGVKSLDDLTAIEPNLEAVEALSEQYDAIGFYVFCETTHYNDRDASARMFAPRFGIAEEAATGMAAGPLACWLHTLHKSSKTHYTIEQGYAMPSPSPSVIEVELQLDGNDITRLLAGGVGQTSQTLHITL